MPDFTSVPTVDLLTRAADAAGKTAGEAMALRGGDWTVLPVILRGTVRPPRLRLIAASGPDHWRAVEATFRAVIAAHPDAGLLASSYCEACVVPTEQCPTLQALRPLAEQVLRDLGETE